MVSIPRSGAATAIALPASIAVGTGVGAAIGGVIAPRVRQIENEAWTRFQVMPPGAYILALGVAQGQIPKAWAQDRAHEQGFSDTAFDHLIDAANIGPGVARAFELWRRGLIGVGGFRRAALRDGLEQEWIDALVGLKDVLLSPAEAANAWQQGYMDEPSASAEAARSGVDAGRSLIQRELAGLPPGPETGLQMLRRGITDDAGFTQMIVEGHTKRKYTDEYLALRHQVLTPQEYASARLRQWVTKAEADAGGALSGYTPAQMDLLFLNRGRPASPTQMWRAWARGATGPRGVPADYPDHAKAIAISDIRPEYAEMLWEIRFNYPSLFQLNRLATSGVIDVNTAADWAHKSLYAPEVIAALRAYWGGTSVAAPHKWADRARSALYTATHGEYLDASIDEPEARSLLARVGAVAGEQDTVIALWDAERGIQRRELTTAQALRLYKKGFKTRAEAYDILTASGLTDDDTNDLLDAV